MTILVPVHRALSTKLAGRSFKVVSRLGYHPWSARVNQSSDHHEPKSTSSQARVGRICFISTRTYATTAAGKPASRPKAHTGRTPAKRTSKAATTDKPGPKTPEGKAKVGAKPKAKTTKAKAKPKPKPTPKPKKPVKKAPSQSALNKERVTKEKALKEAALLDSPKLLPAATWPVFFAESMGVPHDKRDTTRMAQDASQKFKDLRPEEKEHYNHVAHVNKEKNEKAYKQWLSQYTPTQIYQANAARRQLKKIYLEKHPKVKRVSRFPPIHDERLVKQVVTAYAHFVIDRHQSGDFDNMSLRERSPLMAREWKQLSAQEKKKYQDLQQADQRRYVEEYTTVYGKAPGTPMRAAKAA